MGSELMTKGCINMKLKLFLKEVLMKEVQEIPAEFKSELLHELLRLNIERERLLSYFLIGIVSALLCLDGFSSRLWTKDVHIFIHFSFLHVLLLVASVFFLVVINNKRLMGISTNHNNLLHVFYIWLVMLICAIIAVIAVSSGKQPYTYFIAMFSIASMVYLSARERCLIYLVPHTVHVIGVSLSHIETYNKIGEIFFTTLFVSIALLVSGINYYSLTSNFVKNKIIIEKNKELDSLNNLIAQDLEKRTEEFNKMVEYDKLRTTFFANLSHELRTPLTVILSAHQMMGIILQSLKKPERKKDIDQYLRIIKQNCYRLIRLISNMIDITKIDTNYLTLNMRNLDIIRIVEDIVLSVTQFINDKGIQITFYTEIQEECIACDPDKIERIMLNLLSNAVKFTPKGGKIHVSIYNKEQMVEIHVKDTGVGIPEEMKDIVFERFVQVDGTTTRSTEGSGIGLSLVSSLVDMHGGKITLESKPGEGCLFAISLPKRTLDGIEEEKNINKMTSRNIVEAISIEFSDIYG